MFSLRTAEVPVSCVGALHTDGKKCYRPAVVCTLSYGNNAVFLDTRCRLNECSPDLVSRRGTHFLVGAVHISS